ncbi:transcription termination/antitermination protein NusG [Rhizobium sp. AAP43]|uniref:transcription termination/antitermination protein NusG n=1 Tax=Rhizobium sp. AAP43 TaxID=1523420 RepID=UPI0006B93294|nr:transcription termination/antitermination NusG family protein [Rhizobium sp. AAP43]
MMQHRHIEGQVIEITERAIAKRERAICEKANREDRFAAAISAADDSPWFAVRTMTGCEQTVEKVLQDHSIEALVPMRKGKTWRRQGRIVEGRSMPVIHGYVLVRFMPHPTAFEAISSIDKVLGFLRAGEEAKRISHYEVKRFYQRAVAGEYDWKGSQITYAVGEKVRITDGPFAGHIAEVVTRETRKGDVGKDAADLIVVNVEMFCAEHAVTLPLALIEKL